MSRPRAAAHMLETLGSMLLGFATDIRVVHSSLEASRDALGVLVVCDAQVSFDASLPIQAVYAPVEAILTMECELEY